MKIFGYQSFRAASWHVAIGLALLAIVPLSAHYLRLSGVWDMPGVRESWYTAIVFLLIVTGTSAIVLVRQRRRKLKELQNYLHQMSPFPVQAEMPSSHYDFESIRKYMNVVVDDLRTKVNAVEQEKEILQQKLFMAQKMESLRVMAIGISHDFNNLLAAILGNATILTRSLPPDSPARAQVKQIEETTLRAIELTTQIMAYSGRGRYMITEFDLAELINELTRMLESSVGRNVSLSFRIASGIRSIRGDPAQIRQALINLVLNASDSLIDRKGEITVAVSPVSCTAEDLRRCFFNEKAMPGDYVSIEVSDNGCGIPPEILHRISDPFFSTKLRGRGLGLSVVIGVLRAHQGALRVKTAPDQGSTFTLLFPCQGPADGIRTLP